MSLQYLISFSLRSFHENPVNQRRILIYLRNLAAELSMNDYLLRSFDRRHVLAQFCPDLREQEQQANHVWEHHR